MTARPDSNAIADYLEAVIQMKDRPKPFTLRETDREISYEAREIAAALLDDYKTMTRAMMIATVVMNDAARAANQYCGEARTIAIDQAELYQDVMRALTVLALGGEE